MANQSRLRLYLERAVYVSEMSLPEPRLLGSDGFALLNDAVQVEELALVAWGPRDILPPILGLFR